MDVRVVSSAARASLAALLPLGLAACASVDPRPAFHDVTAAVESRGGPAAAWPRTDREEADAEVAARGLLAAPLTAESAARVALLRNRALLAEFEELGVAQADYAQATRIANPTLAGFRRKPSAGDGVNSEVEIAIDLLDVLVQPARKKLAAVELEAAKLRLGQTMLDVAAEAKQACYRLVGAQQTVERLGTVRAIADAAAELARRQRAAGNLAEIDVAQQEAMASEAGVELTRATLEVAEAREKLGVLLGAGEAEGSWSVDSRLPDLPATDPPLDGLAQRALGERLDVQAARFGVDLVGRALSLKRGTRFFPAGIEVGFNRERETDGLRLQGPQLAIQLPIFDTGAASIARLESEQHRARRQLEQLALEAQAEVRVAASALAGTRTMVAAYRDDLLPQRVRILDQTLRHYNMMLTGVYDLLLARRAEVETEKAYIESWRDYWIARVELERALGGPLDAAASPAPTDVTQLSPNGD